MLGLPYTCACMLGWCFAGIAYMCMIQKLQISTYSTCTCTCTRTKVHSRSLEPSFYQYNFALTRPIFTNQALINSSDCAATFLYKQ